MFLKIHILLRIGGCKKFQLRGNEWKSGKLSVLNSPQKSPRQKGSILQRFRKTIWRAKIKTEIVGIAHLRSPYERVFPKREKRSSLSRYFKEPVRSLYAVNLKRLMVLSPQICVSIRDRCVQKLPKSANHNNKSKKIRQKHEKKHALSLKSIFPSQFPLNSFRSKETLSYCSSN